ncbi:hypothetical protein AgCh_009410 [Apium graveolens]
MGLSFTNLFSRLFAKKEMRILMVGLDAVGKTIILYKLKLGEIFTTIPTIGAVRLLKYWGIRVEVVFFCWQIDEFCDVAKGILVAVGPYGPGMSLGSLF